MEKPGYWLCKGLLLFMLLAGPVAIAQEGPVKVSIPRDTYALNGLFFESNAEVEAPIIVLLHGIPGGESDVLGLGEALATAAIHALVFNYSGTHGSGGEWTMANDRGDVQAALQYLRQPEVTDRFRIDTTRIYLGGYSHGGGVALLYAGDHPEITHVFAIGGNDFGEWARKTAADTGFANAVDGLFADWASSGWLRPAEGADRELPDNADQYDVRMRAESLAGKDLLLIGGLDDQTTPVEDHMVPLYRSLQRHGAERVRVVIYQDNHAFGDSKEEIARELIAWIRSAE